MLQELTKNGRKLFFNSVIGFGYIFAKRDSHLKERPSYIKEGNDPYQVLKRINNNAYKIDLQDLEAVVILALISRVFKISQTKLFSK